MLYIIDEMDRCKRKISSCLLPNTQFRYNASLKLNFKKRPFGDADFGVKGSVNTGHSPYDVFSAQKS